MGGGLRNEMLGVEGNLPSLQPVVCVLFKSFVTVYVCYIFKWFFFCNVTKRTKQLQ